MQQQMVLPEGGLASFLTSNLNEIAGTSSPFIAVPNFINTPRYVFTRGIKTITD